MTSENNHLNRRGLTPSAPNTQNTRKSEILAPVGGREQLIAALRSGADAVYLGTPGFNARQNAENFAGSDLPEIVRLCHSRGVNVHITVNTLIKDDEIPALMTEARRIAQAGPDAVIIQDLAVLRIFRECCPDLPLHASTQMVIHNAAGAAAAKKMGFARVVLARELSLDEIRLITSTVDIETEVFIHGALCMSISGGCYLSSVIGERSGNRGYCAQPCRLDFRCEEAGKEKEHALSLKDLSGIRYLRELEQAGVTSFKIEGRMKRPEYVAAAVSACQSARDGLPYDENLLRSVFSRSGFTDGYLTGKRTAAMFGYRRKEDVTAADSVLKKLAAGYQEEPALIPADMELSLFPGKPALLKASCSGAIIRIEGPLPHDALNRPTDEETAFRNLSKTGGTPFLLRRVSLRNPQNQFLSAAELNALRRRALQELEQVLGKTIPYAFVDCSQALILGRSSPQRTGSHRQPALICRFETTSQIPSELLSAHCTRSAAPVPDTLPEPDSAHETRTATPVHALDSDHYQTPVTLILPIGELLKTPDLISRAGCRIIGELPPLLYPRQESELAGQLQALRDLGLRDLAAENLYALFIGQKAGFRIHGGHGLNILNSAALAEYERIGLASATASFELSLNRIRRLHSLIPLGILAYGFLPLMRMRACPLRTEIGCGSCRGKGRLTDRKGKTFPLYCHGREFTTLSNSLPLYLGDSDLKGLDYVTLYFTRETSTAVSAVLRRFMAAEPWPDPNTRTRGLYFRDIK